MNFPSIFFYFVVIIIFPNVQNVSFCRYFFFNKMQPNTSLLCMKSLSCICVWWYYKHKTIHIPDEWAFFFFVNMISYNTRLFLVFCFIYNHLYIVVKCWWQDLIFPSLCLTYTLAFSPLFPYSTQHFICHKKMYQFSVKPNKFILLQIKPGIFFFYKS